MQIEIPNDDYQRLAGLAAASGYGDVSAYVAALASGTGAFVRPIPPALADDLSPEEAVARFGAGVIDDPSAGAASSWPPNESVAAWIEELRKLRRRGDVRQTP